MFLKICIFVVPDVKSRGRGGGGGRFTKLTVVFLPQLSVATGRPRKSVITVQPSTSTFHSGLELIHDHSTWTYVKQITLEWSAV
jgi:hypothetical protein